MSEKEIFEKARSLGRRNMLELMEHALEEERGAMKSIFYEGTHVADVIDFGTRQAARAWIAEKCGFKTAEAQEDLARRLLAVFVDLPEGEE